MVWSLIASAAISLLFVLCVSFLLILPTLRQRRASREENPFVSLLAVPQQKESLEQAVSGLVVAGRRNRRATSYHILLIDNGADDETVHLCLCLSKRWENVVHYCKTLAFAEAVMDELLIAKEPEF